MAYSWQGSTGRRILGYSVMAIAIGGLVLLFFGYVIFNYFSNTMSTLNATLIGGGSQVIGNVSSALQQTFNVTYTDPFVTTALGYLSLYIGTKYSLMTPQGIMFLYLYIVTFEVTYLFPFSSPSMYAIISLPL